ncbi:two-component system, chemotaxis family, CheB/CheR fusion protein [Tindallia californiensis]|uniref:protein-glutamate O-methyltransferase n=2 Tax=Tindallia californiensis TaxID=159292 RepID=A0A1H3LK71_9FIRM|nr:two-component system, chemotaxis family, CheB/CheR fusion protein [Tindallia californiensis]
MDHSQKEKQIKPVYYVGVGASAGGLEALQQFFHAMPKDTGMAFIVVQHLSPDYKSMMDELLARCTSMTISIAKDGTEVEANHVYLIPPRYNLMIFHGKLYLEKHSTHKTNNLPIDVFFRSLAADQGKKAVAVVLSGTGSDGTLGIRSIKEAGGMIMVQDEKSAKFDGMPRSSISTGLVDYILTPEKMAEELLNYIRHPFIQKSKSLEENMPENIDTLAKINLILRNYSGIDFSYYKENTITRRLERRVSINRCQTLEEYLQLLVESDKEKDILYRELLIGVTGFFRDAEAFQCLRKDVIRKLTKEDTLRIWSAGCSTGEEVYTLAMLCLEERQHTNPNCDVKIFATDIDRHSLDVASQGFYPDSLLSDVHPELLAKYFTKVENGYQVNEEVRKLVVFATHNLLKDPPFSKLNLMVCRNLFIYLKPSMQQKILNMFYYSLSPGGYLFMGNSESLGEMSEGFNTINSKWKIYQYKEGFQPPVIGEIQSLTPKNKEQVEWWEPEGNPHKHKQINRICDSVMQVALPPSVVIDGQDHIIQVINDMNPFFEVKSGKFSPILFHNLPADLSIYASGLVRRLRQGKKELMYENISELERYPGELITLEGRSFSVDNIRYYLLSFVKRQAKASKMKTTDTKTGVREEMSQRIQELEKELQVSRENLQATVEELETSNEELQSSNEELIASNEELQSTNEELQSVNEELYTVNSEYQIKIDELTQANNDLNNLLNNTDVGAIYLDRKRCIRKITPMVTHLTHIRDSDIGRPIAHISTLDNYPELLEDVHQVMEKLRSVEREILAEDGRTWFCRIRPYRTSYNAVEGVLITFVDITKLKQVESDLGESRQQLKEAMEKRGESKVFRSEEVKT